jgi:hypothetical protein
MEESCLTMSCEWSFDLPSASSACGENQSSKVSRVVRGGVRVRLSAYANVVVLGEVVQELLPHQRIVQETRQLVSYVLDGFICKRPRTSRQSLSGLLCSTALPRTGRSRSRAL